MTKKLYILNTQSRPRAMQAVADAADGWRVTLDEPRRSGEQNAKFHAICSDLATSRLKWFGKPRVLEEWKVLLVSGHAAATGRGTEVVPGIESELVALRESTASMSKARGSSLIEYAQAFCVANNVELHEP